MAAGAGESQEVERLLSYADDLLGVFRVSTDRDDNAQVGAGARRLVSACRSESDDLELQIKEYQEKIDSCKEKIDKAKVETIADDELNALQSKMEEKLQEEKQLRKELRVVHDELDDLDCQRVSIKERTDAVKKKKKDTQKAKFPHEPRNIATTNRVKGDESGKSDRRLSISSANVITRSQNKHSAVTPGTKNITSGRILEAIAGDGKSDKNDCRVASEFIYDKRDTSGQIVKHTDYGEEDQRNAMDNQRGEIVASKDKEVSDDEEYTLDIILPKSRHRDGSIYRDMDRWWKSLFHIADRNETRLEAMALSNPPSCIIRNGTCVKHYPRRMLQILSLELDGFLVDGGLVELYGYIAVRDQLDPLLNYVVNFSRDDPIVVEQGSLINMTGPKRGIDIMDLSLIEYDMRIKTGEEEKNDLQLIDGASLIGSAGEWDQPLTMRIPGNYGAVDITLSRFNSAVEATVEVLISEVQCSFNLSLTCLTSQLSKEIRLFHGAIAGSRGLQRSVVAIPWNSSINLKFKVGALSSSSNQHYCSFMAKVHGHDTQEINTLFALISVKVTWSMLPIALGCLY